MPATAPTPAAPTPDAGAPANAGVHFPPPFIFVIAWLVAWGLSFLWRFHLAPDEPTRRVLTAVGMVVFALGLGFDFWGFGTFLLQRTAIIPFKPASHLVRTGPYRFSRNPMYVGFSFAYLGLALMTDRGWPIVLLPLVLLALYRMVIRREERYLESAFPAEYAEYRRTVRRWL